MAGIKDYHRETNQGQAMTENDLSIADTLSTCLVNSIELIISADLMDKNKK